MALIRWEPFREIDTLQRQMNRLFDQMIMVPGDGGRDIMTAGISFVPAAEMQETTDQVILKMELPGIEAKDLDVQVTAEAVSISGERKSKLKSEDKGIKRSEFSYGRFQRVIPLPAKVQNDKVQAKFQNGILHLTMPKAEEEKNKVVTINLGEQSNQGQLQSEQPQQIQNQQQQQQQAQQN